MHFKEFQIDENTTINVSESPDCDMVDPILHFGERLIAINSQINRIRLQQFLAYDNKLSPQGQIELNGRINEIEIQQSKKQLEEIIKAPLPIEIDQLFSESKKKKQQKTIKTLRYNSNMFMSVPIYAWQKYNMPYSKFTVDFLPKELDSKKFPEMLRKKDNGDFEYFGDTDMSKGEMKNAIEKRNRVITEFVGNRDNWHCFFRTLAGIKGLEHPHIGQPHLHYISSAWGISRDTVIENLSGYRYTLNAEQIPFDTDSI